MTALAEALCITTHVTSWEERAEAITELLAKQVHEAALMMETVSSFTLSHTPLARQHWCASVRAEIGGDNLLSGCTVWSDTPDQAVLDLLDKMKAVAEPMYLVTSATGGTDRRHFRWNGVGFASLPIVGKRKS